MGSQRSSTCLENRVKRHIRSSYSDIPDVIPPKKHWHIDYFLTQKSTRIIRIELFPSQIKDECEIANILMEKTDSFINSFGASDCKCKSHLFFSEDEPYFS